MPSAARSPASIDLDDLLWIVVTQLARLMNAEVAILMPEKSAAETGKLVLRAAFPPDSEFSDADLAAARWSWDAERPTGRGTDTLPGGRWLFMPIRTSRSSIGVIGVLPPTGEAGLPAPARRLLEAVGNQAAVAIERVALAADIDQARLRRGARAAALGHADLGVARPAHAARLDHRRAVEPQELRRPLRRGDARANCWARR